MQIASSTGKVTLTNPELLAYMKELGRICVGLERPAFLIAVGLAARLHILAKAQPGTGKSHISKALHKVTGLKLVRVQGDAGMKPAAITGAMVERRAGLEFRPSPLLGMNIALFDEFDRSTSEVQNAPLEAAAENQISVVGHGTDLLEEIFQIIATINGTESEGTFPPGNATMDRFGLQLTWPKLSRIQLAEINGNKVLRENAHPETVLAQQISDNDILAWRAGTNRVMANSTGNIRDLIAELACCLDPDREEFDRLRTANGEKFTDLIAWGGAERCNKFLMAAAAAVAYFTGDEAISPVHVALIFPDAARSHFSMAPKALRQKITQDHFIAAVLGSVMPK